MFAKDSRRALQVRDLLRLRAAQRGSRVIDVGDLLGALVVEDQGGYAKAISVIPPAPPPKKYPRGTVSYDISRGLPLPFIGFPKRRRIVPGPKKPFFPPETASGILAALDKSLSRGTPLPYYGTNIMADASVHRALDAADALVYGKQSVPEEPLRILAWAVFFHLTERKRVQPLHLLAAALGEESDPSVQIFLRAGITREKVLDTLKAGHS